MTVFPLSLTCSSLLNCASHGLSLHIILSLLFYSFKIVMFLSFFYFSLFSFAFVFIVFYLFLFLLSLLLVWHLFSHDMEPCDLLCRCFWYLLLVTAVHWGMKGVSCTLTICTLTDSRIPDPTLVQSTQV